MLLNRSAPLATVDHFNGRLLALSNFSSQQNEYVGSQKRGASSVVLFWQKRKKERKKSSPWKLQYLRQQHPWHAIILDSVFLFSFFSWNRKKDCADATAKILPRIIFQWKTSQENTESHSVTTTHWWWYVLSVDTHRRNLMKNDVEAISQKMT